MRTFESLSLASLKIVSMCALSPAGKNWNANNDRWGLDLLPRARCKREDIFKPAEARRMHTGYDTIAVCRMQRRFLSAHLRQSNLNSPPRKTRPLIMTHGGPLSKPRHNTTEGTSEVDC